MKSTDKPKKQLTLIKISIAFAPLTFTPNFSIHMPLKVFLLKTKKWNKFRMDNRIMKMIQNLSIKIQAC